MAHYAKGTRLPGCPGSHCLRAYGFRIYFTPLTGCFSPFPHGTGSLSVVRKYLALEGGPPGFPQGFSCPVVLGIPLGWFGISPTRLSRSLVGRPRPFDYPSPIPHRGPATPRKVAFPGFRLFPVRSPLLGESRLIYFPPGTEMFHFPGLASAAYGFSGRYPDVTRDGLPHSEIPGSKPVGGSPGLIAACYVLHCLLTPRHPPYALQSLTVNPLPLNTPALSQRSCLYPVAIFSCQRAALLASASNIENCKLKTSKWPSRSFYNFKFTISNFQ